MKKKNNIPYYKWTCPACGDVCFDPSDFRTTECHNHHIVILGQIIVEKFTGSYQEAFLIKKEKE